MFGVFGAAGLSIPRITQAITRLKDKLKDLPFAVNLIHNNSEPCWEWDLVQLLLDQQVKIVEASAFMDLSLPLIYYRVKGIHLDDTGHVQVPNKVFVKVSRLELAEKFFSPTSIDALRKLYEDGYISLKKPSWLRISQSPSISPQKQILAGIPIIVRR